MRARDLMTEGAVTLTHNATIGDALAVIGEHEVRHIPIVQRGGLVGVVSDRDLRRVEGLFARAIGLPDAGEQILEMPVITLVSGDPVTVGIDDHLDDVIDRMLDEAVGAVVVVDNQRRVLGIVSYVDILRAARGRLR